MTISLLPPPTRGNIHLTPAESRALGRFFTDLVRHLGWGWGSATFAGIAGTALAVWTAPDWWPVVRDWLNQ